MRDCAGVWVSGGPCLVCLGLILFWGTGFSWWGVLAGGLVVTGGWGVAAQGWWGLCGAIGGMSWWDVARRATTQGCPYVALGSGGGS